MSVRISHTGRSLLLVPVLLGAGVAAPVLPAHGQNRQSIGESGGRKIRPVEQALLDRIAAEFAKILPPIPAGWVETERRVFDAEGMVADAEAPIQADYEWHIAVADLDARQKVVEKRREELVDAKRDDLDAAAARNQKMMEEFSARLQAAIARNDQKEAQRLQEEYEKKMAAGAQAAAPPKVAAPELSDSYARIHIWINPYNSPSFASDKRLTTPPGFTGAGRRESDENGEGREGVTSYLLGQWVLTEGGDYSLKFTSSRLSAVYGIRVEIEARADRAEALFRAMSRVRLQALLQP